MPKHKAKAKSRIKAKAKAKPKAKKKKTAAGGSKRLEEILLVVIDRLGAGVVRSDRGNLLVTRHNRPSFEIDTKRGVIIEDLPPPPVGATTVAETTGDAA